MKRFFTFSGVLLIPIITLFTWHEIHRPVYSVQRVAVDRAGGGDGTLSPDGKRFVISSKRSGNWDIWMYDIPAATWTQLTNDPADDFEGRWSPDGTRLVFCSTRAGQKNIWLLTLSTHEVKQLTFAKDNDEEYPAWSPDGKQIVYTAGPWGRRDYYLIPSEGGTPRRVTRQSGLGGACTFEPHGESLICHRYDLGTGNLLRVWLDNGEISPVTIGSAWDYKPTTSPDNHWIAFSRSEEGPSHIWLLPAAGGRPHQLTQSPYDDRWPTWDAAGDRLFFHRIVERGTALKILDRRTGAVRSLVNEAESPLQAAFDPQARRVVYCSLVDNHQVLKILDLETGSIRTLNTGAGDDSYPRWSPDGQHIAFISKEGDRREISIVKPDGTGLETLTSGNSEVHGINGAIDWSPDSSRVVFHADTKPFEALLYTVDVHTRRLVNLTKGAWFDESPSWTPDGKGILFMSTRGGDWTWGFFRLSLQNGSLEPVVKPDWVEKNFPRMATNNLMIWSMHDEHDTEMLVERSPRGQVHVWTEAGPGARWPSYSTDGNLVLFTTVEHQVEYWIAENPTADGSPINEMRAAVEEKPTDSAQVCRLGPRPDGPQRSPVDMFRR